MWNNVGTITVLLRIGAASAALRFWSGSTISTIGFRPVRSRNSSHRNLLFRFHDSVFISGGFHFGSGILSLIFYYLTMLGCFRRKMREPRFISPGHRGNLTVFPTPWTFLLRRPFIRSGGDQWAWAPKSRWTIWMEVTLPRKRRRLKDQRRRHTFLLFFFVFLSMFGMTTTRIGR